MQVLGVVGVGDEVEEVPSRVAGRVKAAHSSATKAQLLVVGHTLAQAGDALVSWKRKIHDL